METRMIVKVQLPVNNKGDFALVYNEGKKFQTVIPITSVKNKMGDTMKKFFYCTMADKAFRIDEEAPWQNW